MPRDETLGNLAAAVAIKIAAAASMAALFIAFVGSAALESMVI